jgi:hypothetical protein
MEGEAYDPLEDLGFNNGAACPAYPGERTPGANVPGRGFGFSGPEIMRLASRRIRLRRARQLQQQPLNRAKRPEPTPMPTTKVA